MTSHSIFVTRWADSLSLFAKPNHEVIKVPFQVIKVAYPRRISLIR